ncbi:MAG: N-formylglutamate amidohydrolase [Litoreibacter sp.]
MSQTSFTLALPTRQTTSVVFASPHSGRYYPPDFLTSSVLDERTIRSSEDAFMDMLVKPASDFGAPFIHAKYPRAYLDLNRSSDELDPAVIAGVRGTVHNPRILSGLGVIPRVVANGREIYRGKIKLREAYDRIETVWRPYHNSLENLLNSTRAQFGEAVLIDFHSMPHEASDTISRPSFTRPEVVLGDRFGAAAAPEIVERIENVFLAAGLKVSRNAPFAGAYIVQNYGRPSKRQHAVQVEIDRALYMNEQFVRPNTNFNAFQKLMVQIVAELADIGCKTVPLAAE